VRAQVNVVGHPPADQPAPVAPERRTYVISA